MLGPQEPKVSYLCLAGVNKNLQKTNQKNSGESCLWDFLRLNFGNQGVLI